MRLLRPGQDTVLSWRSGAVECRVVAAAGQFVLLRPERADPSDVPEGDCSLTYLDGMVPMGWDGIVEPGGASGELRFRVGAAGLAADRRSSARVPLSAAVAVELDDGETLAAALMDVSAGGLRFRAPGRLAPGTAVHVRCELHEGVELDADAVVRTSEPGVASVEFTALHGADAQTIGAWTVGVLRASLAGQG